MLGIGDNQDVADTGKHQHGEGIVNHGFVVNRQQLFADAVSDRVKARAFAAC
jgi:hypothetical protein